MQKKFKYLSASNIQKQTVIIRADLDIRVVDGEVLDNSKLKSIVPTVQFLQENNCKIIILGTHGECDGEFDDTLSLMDIRFELGRLLEKPIKFANVSSCENSIKFMDFGEILMIENLAFHKEEFDKSKDDKSGYLEKLIQLADAFVIETFEDPAESTSVRLLSKFVKNRFIGLGIEALVKEFETIKTKKFTVILGGSLNRDTVTLFENIIEYTDKLLLSNDMALAVIKEQGIKIGNHRFEDKLQKRIKTVLNKIKKNKIQMELPEDFIVMDSKDRVERIPTQSIKSGYLVKDIGEKTTEKYKTIIEESENIMWVGSCGDTLQESTSLGTKAIGESITLSAPKISYKVIIGEDILVATSKLNLKTKRINLLVPSVQSFMHFLDSSVFDILKKFIDRG